jgi:hypothetical protein
VDAPAWYEPWRAGFERSERILDLPDLQVPEGDALVALCERFRFPATAREALVAQRAGWDEPRIRRLGAHAQHLYAERYSPAGLLALGWPPPPAACPLLYAFAALGVAARTVAAHRALGIPGEVTEATLWDVGQQVALHARIHGGAGMRKGHWLAHHLASHLFRLGRLQFQRSRAGAGCEPIAADEAYLDVHVPEAGRLDPGACDASFAAARQFFRAHFPADRPRWLACSSWLLDPQLAEILPADSNIVRFQRRFALVRVHRGVVSRVFEFVFHRPDLDPAREPALDGLPRATGLERALVRHYAEGGRIWPAFGVAPLA